jgi:crotonobetainyl-CoA:carnitine CoA-transferase CaiB-like acyl-CoA transferase
VPGPLEGIKVVELGVWVAAPAAGGILADWGADVIKIEPPSGDPARMFGRMMQIESGVNPPFEMDNRSKRSIVLDLTTADGLRVALELLADADVFVTNVRPSALLRLGLDFEALATRNPRLVYGLISGYGTVGPDGDSAAYDIAAFWARAGIADLLTRPGDTPPFQRGGMGDHSVAMTLAGAVCAALVARQQSGTGQLVSTSLYRQGAYTVSFDLNTLLLTGQQVAIGQRESMGNPCMNNYAAGDGRRFWIVGLQGERHWPALCRAVGRTDWLDECAFRDGAGQGGECDDADRRVGRVVRDEAARRVGGDLRRRTRLLLVAGQLDLRRAGRRPVPCRGWRGLRSRRGIHQTDGGHGCPPTGRIRKAHA